jgi:hypothetical protein
MYFFGLLAFLAHFSFVFSYAHYGSSNFGASPHDGLSLQLHRRDNNGSVEPVLIGDLRYKIATPVGRNVSEILLKKLTGLTNDTATPPASLSACDTSIDPCCTWWFVSKFLTENFVDSNGQCNELARGAIRQGYSDAATWSQVLADDGSDYGGADGSLVIFHEYQRPENTGLEAIANFTLDVWGQFDVGMADLIQYMAVHAVVTCPQGPRVRAFVGRKDAEQQSLGNLLPDMYDDADTIISLFMNKTIPPRDLTALLGAHSTSMMFNDRVPGEALSRDTTPGIMVFIRICQSQLCTG